MLSLPPFAFPAGVHRPDPPHFPGFGPGVRQALPGGDAAHVPAAVLRRQRRHLLHPDHLLRRRLRDRPWPERHHRLAHAGGRDSAGIWGLFCSILSI